MTIYVGETTRIYSRILDFNSGTVDDGSSVTVTIDISFAGDLVVEDGEMSWEGTGNEDGPYWFYDWDTSAEAAGTYLTKITCVGPNPEEPLDTLTAFEYGRVRIKAPRF